MRNSIPNHLINPIALKYDDYIKEYVEAQKPLPFYVYSKRIITESYEKLKRFLPEYFAIYYSLKANPNEDILKCFMELGAKFEICSIGEMEKIVKVSGDLRNAIFVGPGKTQKELKYAIRNKISYIVVESECQANRINEICVKENISIRVALRVNPGAGRGSVSMGGDTQFGMDIQTAINIIMHKEDYSKLHICGFHAYVGTGNTDGKNILQNTKLILEAFDDLVQETGHEFVFLDIGGGFGIPYTVRDDFLDLDEIKKSFCMLIDSCRKKHSSLKEIAMESGRFLVGEAGMYVTSAIDKKTCNSKNYIILDGGMNSFHNSLSRTGFTATPMRVIQKNPNDELECVTICGSLCTPVDRYANNVVTNKIDVGDLVIFYNAGAYAFSASPILFLSHPLVDEFVLE